MRRVGASWRVEGEGATLNKHSGLDLDDDLVFLMAPLRSKSDVKMCNCTYGGLVRSAARKSWISFL